MPNSVTETQGYITECFYYDPCPLCYKCRNYKRYTSFRCDVRCGGNLRNNVCMKPELHNEANFAKMITRPRLDMDEEGRK